MRPTFPIKPFLIVWAIWLSTSPDSGAQSSSLQPFGSLTYEYRCDSDSCNRPLVIALPGFTQYNATPEFALLKSLFDRRNLDYLIVNPRQHGTRNALGKPFSWGEDELEEIVALLDSLGIWRHHDGAHLFGFSIGAKLALRLGAHYAGSSAPIRSVIAVAPPWRVSDIDMRLSGDIRRPFESMGSTRAAFRRSSIKRMAYMTLVGMPRALLVNTASPANIIDQIEAPVLLVHSTNDWLTKSWHGKRLFQRGRPDQQIAFVALHTHTHAEDMLTRHDEAVRDAFLEIIERWFDLARRDGQSANKTEFDAAFRTSLASGDHITSRLVPLHRVSMVRLPDYYDHNAGVWISQPDVNHASASLSAAYDAESGQGLHLFGAIGSVGSRLQALQRFRVGIASHPGLETTKRSTDLYTSFYYPLGTFLLLRKITWIQGIDQNTKTSLVSGDFSLLTADILVRYGVFHRNETRKKAWQLDFNIPLIGNASASYIVGVGYSRFLEEMPDPFAANSLRAFLFLGTPPTTSRTRLRGSIHYEQDRINPTRARRRFSWGLSINLNEQ